MSGSASDRSWTWTGLGLEVLASSIGASVPPALFSPLELVKTRLQAQGTSGLPVIYRGGFLPSLQAIYRSDGVFLTHSHGWLPFVARDFLYCGLRLGLYPTMRSLVAGGRESTRSSSGNGISSGSSGSSSGSSSSSSGSSIALVDRIIAGGLTGAFGSALATPLDLVRVRMSCDGGRVDTRTGLLATGLRAGKPPEWASSRACLRDTVAREGLRGMYRGTGPTAVRAFVISGAHLASYDHSKGLLAARGWNEGPAMHAACATVAAFFATTASLPPDNIKSRVMVARRGSSVTVRVRKASAKGAKSNEGCPVVVGNPL